MFGYVKPFVPNLRVKEHELYKSIYCGLCRSMQTHTGNVSRVTLSFDMTFFALVRLALSDTDISIRKRRCAVHPLHKRPMMDDNGALTYTAYVSALLTAYKVDDTLEDEKGMRRLGARLVVPYASFLKKKAKRAEFEIEALVSGKMAELRRLEIEKCAIPDMPAEVFGSLLGELMAMGLDEKRALIAREIGLHTGKFVYLTDAAADYFDDMKSGSYNPFLLSLSEEDMKDFRENTLRGVLTMEADAILRAMALIDFADKAMLRACIENIITDGMEHAIFMALGKENENGK